VNFPKFRVEYEWAAVFSSKPAHSTVSESETRQNSKIGPTQADH